MATVASAARKTRPPKVKRLRVIEIGGGDSKLIIPRTVIDHESYLRWVHSASYPEKAQTAWLNGILWIETEMEEILAHGLVKTRIGSVLAYLVESADSGYMLIDGVLVSNTSAGVSNEPDAVYASYDSIESGRVELVAGKKGGLTEVRGSPDMVLEVVGPSSVQKDTVELRALYYRAGIAEYWLVDARGGDVRFDLLRRGTKGFVATRKRGGWLRSGVFTRNFRIDRKTDRLGFPRIQLLVT